VTTGLELLHLEAPGPGDAAPILLIHGAWHSASCWREFAAYLNTAGRDCYALSLRGHGNSGNDRPLRLTRIDGYVADVGETVARIDAASGRKPILVGHSMGGLVTQKYIEHDQQIPRAVLLASVPVNGVWWTALRLSARHPLAALNANLTWRLWPYVGSPELARDAFFSPAIAAERLAAHFAELQDESYLAFLDMLVLRLPKPDRVRVPVTVMGAANDSIFSVREVEATARAYDTEAVIFPDMAHNMMQDQGWEKVADELLARTENTNG
jgi:pimeloyl-ACP methyl ester carboxylesterase